MEEAKDEEVQGRMGVTETLWVTGGPHGSPPPLPVLPETSMFIHVQRTPWSDDPMDGPTVKQTPPLRPAAFVKFEVFVGHMGGGVIVFFA